MINRDDNFYDLGYTRPEEAERLHVEKLARQDFATRDKSPARDRKRRPGGSVRDYESDRDHPEIHAEPEHLSDPEPEQPPLPGIGKLLAEAALQGLRERATQDKIERLAGDDGRLRAALARKALERNESRRTQ